MVPLVCLLGESAMMAPSCTDRTALGSPVLLHLDLIREVLFSDFTTMTQIFGEHTKQLTFSEPLALSLNTCNPFQ